MVFNECQNNHVLFSAVLCVSSDPEGAGVSPDVFVSEHEGRPGNYEIRLRKQVLGSGEGSAKVKGQSEKARKRESWEAWRPNKIK